jgi:hypothetical protein
MSNSIFENSFSFFFKLNVFDHDQVKLRLLQYSRSCCTQREPNCRNAFALSLSPFLSLVATTTADVASTSIVSIIIIISYTLFPFLCLSFFFFILVVVVLAATTTRFSFFFSFSIAFFSIYTSVVSYQQIHCSTD